MRWETILRVKAKFVADVADAINKGKAEVKEWYDKMLADNYGVDGSIEVVEVIERPRSVVVVVEGPDVRVNVVSDALERVVPGHYDVGFPYWS
ncbi:MAG: hypothetical protein ACREGR_01625 [Minisyncoccia bacterium]